jgi:beta-glucosidase
MLSHFLATLKSTLHSSVCCAMLAGAMIGYLLPFHSTVKAQTGFLRPNPSIEGKVDSLVAIMTVEEKMGQLNQLARVWDITAGRLGTAATDLLKRGLVGSFLNVVGAERTRNIQRIAVQQTRLHIPLIFGLDVIHGYRTVFPIPLGEAASWDPAMVQQDARIAAVEASAGGINWTFAPMVDIARDPRWGRIAEGSGEDPYLGSVMAAARVRGFQGSDFSDPTAIVACAKHFAAYGGAEGGRDYNTVDISERTLRDVYLPPFHAAVDAGVGTLMSAFNEIGGVPSTANPLLLTEILRNEWGFRGFVVSDWNAVGELMNHGIAADTIQAAVRALTAGVDMDMQSQVYLSGLPFVVRDSSVSMNILNEAVRRVLRVKYASGLFKDPYRNCRESVEQRVILTPEHRAAARRAACRSMVLLRNSGGVLPLSPGITSLAVIGALAESSRDPLGPWHCEGRAEDVVPILQGIKKALSEHTRLMYARGYNLAFSDTSGFSEATRAAMASDAVVLVVGETEDMSGEASSRADISLPGIQPDLVKRIYATGKPIVLVLMNGRPLCIPWEAEHIRAILEAWFPGVEAGNAVADVLFGKVNPGGKLPATFPRSVGQIPLYYDHKNTGRPFLAEEKYTSRYIDFPETPLFPFGFGLSYTTYSFDNLRVPTEAVTIGQPVSLSVDLRNTGSVRGDEVVEVYVRQRYATITRPVLELKAFRRITLDPGEKQTVEFTLDSGQLGYTGDAMKYTVEPGVFQVFVGGSSDATIAGRFSLVR